MAGEMDRVVPLDELDDFEIAEGDPDVRGWNVLGSDGRNIGAVENLLIDTAAMKVRYLDVDVDDELLDDDTDRHVLIPIGYARLDEDDDRIFVDAMTSADIAGLPAYTHEPLTRDFETRLRERFDTDYTTSETTAADDFYEHHLYDQDRFYNSPRDVDGEARVTLSEEELAVGKREVRAGEVEIDKDVETRHVREPVQTRHEEVVVERRPASAGTGAKPHIEDEEIHVPVTEEELVVEKRTVPKEELVVRKQEVVDEEVVEADLRRERAEVRREGDVDVRDR